MLYLDLSFRQRSAMCPSCQYRFAAVHSSYRHTIADLPMAGTQVILHLQVRRFFCEQVACPQRIFAERFPAPVPVYGRHSLGVCAALRHMGIAIGGRAGAWLTHALGIPGSSRTILRFVHRAPFPRSERAVCRGDSTRGTTGGAGHRSCPPGAESARCLGAALSPLSAGPQHPGHFLESIRGVNSPPWND